jgi:hypothetical protein
MNRLYSYQILDKQFWTEENTTIQLSMAKFKSFVIKHSSQKQTSHVWTQIEKHKIFPTRTVEFQIVHQSIQHPIQSHEDQIPKAIYGKQITIRSVIHNTTLCYDH